MRLAGAVRPTFLNPKIGLGFAYSMSKRVSGRAAFCRAAFELTSFAPALSFALILALALVVVPSAVAQDDIASRRASAQDQFERAEAQRSALEAKAERERSVRDYEDLVSAYRRVYLITPNAVEVPPAIKDVADLYRRMGEQFEASYFRSAITTYEFLIHDYPASSLREEAQLAIAEIRRKNLSQSDRTQLDLAQKNYEDFLEQYPHSANAAQARKALAEIQAAKKAPAAPQAASAAAAGRAPLGAAAGTAPGTGAGTVAAGAAPSSAATSSAATSSAATSGTEPEQGSEVSRVRVWNADNYTRIIIELGGKAKYQAARISDPDRIYFDIDNAKLSSELLHAPIEVPSGGYLKAVRVAQNRSDTVRVVLDVAKVKDYSVFELAGPDRLVVDVYGPGTHDAAAANSSAKPVADSGASASTKPAAKASAKAAPAPAVTSAAHPATAQILPASIPTVGLLPIPAKFTAALIPMPVSARLTDSGTGSGTGSASAGADSESVKVLAEKIGPPPAAKPTRAGERSLTRALGLKIGRIVIDPGHGGHDTGTIGPTGLMEKDLCLDVALRLGKLIEQRLPSDEIVYTRQNDKYVGLEQRTAIANEAKADLFVSIHANSSDDASVSGIETYYLNFNASPQAMEVAARENATAQSSVHDLQDLVTKIAANEKVEESRDLAANIQDSLAAAMRVSNRPERNRGVRKAPFVVLVGADMPSVLAEISFISNPADEQLLKKPENRQRAAEGLFSGIERYLRSVNSLSTTISPSASVAAPQ
jgi:N-acetylmuramoyl-L-alanine amidase